MKNYYPRLFEKFSEISDDPIKDMGIGIEAMDKLYKWDWSTTQYPYKNEAEIIDIIEYRGSHLKIMRVTRFNEKFKYNPFYIAITDIGEPYIGDGPYPFDTLKKAIKGGKSNLDNYLDD